MSKRNQICSDIWNVVYNLIHKRFLSIYTVSVCEKRPTVFRE